MKKGLELFIIRLPIQSSHPFVDTIILQHDMTLSEGNLTAIATAIVGGEISNMLDMSQWSGDSGRPAISCLISQQIGHTNQGDQQ